MLNFISVFVLTYEFMERPTSWKLSSLSRWQIRNLLVFCVEVQVKMLCSNKAEAFVATIKYSSFSTAQALDFCVYVWFFCDCILTWLQWLAKICVTPLLEKQLFFRAFSSLSLPPAQMCHNDIVCPEVLQPSKPGFWHNSC